MKERTCLADSNSASLSSTSLFLRCSACLVPARIANEWRHPISTQTFYFFLNKNSPSRVVRLASSSLRSSSASRAIFLAADFIPEKMNQQMNQFDLNCGHFFLILKREREILSHLACDSVSSRRVCCRSRCRLRLLAAAASDSARCRSASSRCSLAITSWL